MGNSSSSRKRSPTTRLIPRESLQEKFYIAEEEPGYPPVRHPATSTKDVYNARDNRDIYFHALRAPKDIEKSWDALVHYLTSIYRTDMMKLRSIFSWLGCQDIENERLGGASTPSNIDEITPRGYKKIIQEREGSYATMFTLLCRKAGLKCAIINGISKGHGYEVGDTDVSQLRDRWVAVYVEGWRLIHPLWAYKCVLSFKPGKWAPDQDIKEKMQITDLKEDLRAMEHDFNEYYFLVDPLELVSVCLPDDPKWQMRAMPITLEKWVDMPYLPKRYHMEGFKICSEYTSILHSKNGISALAIRAPVSVKESIEHQLSYDCYFNFAETRPRVDDPIHLKRYVLMSRDSKEKKWTFEMRMPVAGMFRVTVYGGPSNKTELPWICDVGVRCEKPMKNPKPYPDSPMIGYGPVYLTERAGLTNPSHPNGVLFVNPRQILHITFKLTETILAKAHIVGKDVQEKEMNKWVTCTINNQSKIQLLDVQVQVQKEGEYALKIMVRPRDLNVPFKNVCNYYLSTDPPRDNGVNIRDKGYKSARELNVRKALDEASRGKDLISLKAAVQQFETQGLHEVDGTFGKASQKMDYLELVKGLKDAIMRRNLDLLQKNIKKAEESEHAEKLGKLLTQARMERDMLLQMDRFTHAVLEMKQSTISELTSYMKPIQLIHDVLSATLLLLGESKHNVETWNHVQACMRQTGRGSVLRRVREFDIASITMNVIRDVQQRVTLYTEDEVRAASVGAATFYCWRKSGLQLPHQQIQ